MFFSSLALLRCILNETPVCTMTLDTVLSDRIIWNCVTYYYRTYIEKSSLLKVISANIVSVKQRIDITRFHLFHSFSRVYFALFAMTAISSDYHSKWKHTSNWLYAKMCVFRRSISSVWIAFECKQSNNHQNSIYGLNFSINCGIFDLDFFFWFRYCFFCSILLIFSFFSSFGSFRWKMFT